MINSRIILGRTSDKPFVNRITNSAYIRFGLKVFLGKHASDISSLLWKFQGTFVS